MKPKFNHESSGLKRTLARIGITLGAILALSVPIFSQDYPPGKLWVTFYPGAFDSLADSNGYKVYQLSYLDSVNIANECSTIVSDSVHGLDSTEYDYMVYFPDSVNLLEIADAYLADSRVRYATPDYYIELLYTPNDPLLNRSGNTPECHQWNLDSTHSQFEKAWDITKGDSSVVIAIIDVGIFYHHPDLFGNLWINGPEDFNGNGTFEPWRSDSSVPGDFNGDDDDGNGFKDDVVGWNFMWGDSTPYIDSLGDTVDACIFKGHGTVTASIASAVTDSQYGIAGAGFKCRLMLVTGIPACELNTMSWATKAIRYASKMKADVINMSWKTLGPPDNQLKNAIDLAYGKEKIVLVAASGNDQTPYPVANYPARDPNVLSVTGLRIDDVHHSKATFDTTVDLAAAMYTWGAHIFDTGVAYKPVIKYSFDGCGGSGYPCLQDYIDTLGCLPVGTSISAPQVAGAAALIKAAYPTFSPAAIMAKLKTSTDSIYHLPGNDSTHAWYHLLGTGRLNAFKAVTFFGNIPGETFTGDTTLRGTVYVSGDIRVRAGKTLRLDSGCVLRFYPGDVLKKGMDTTLTEIVVDSGGKLFIGNSSGPPVKLVSFRREQDSATTNDWRGIVVKPGGYLSINNAIIRHAYAGIEDSSQLLHTIQNVRFGRCKMYGILAIYTDSLTIRGCRVDSVNANPGGYGINVDASSFNGPGTHLIQDTVWACYKGIYLHFSPAPVDSCLVQGSSGGPWSHTGVLADYQNYMGDSLPIHSTSINGYFAAQHFENGYKGRAALTNCNLITDEAQRSPYGIWNVGYQCSLKVRRTKVLDWSYKGVATGHNNWQGTDLGIATSTDSGLNTITTTMPIWDEETEKPILWYYVTDNDCGSCTTPVIYAEANWWGGCPPTYNTRFSNNIDRTPCLSSAPPKLVADEGGTGTLPKPTALFQNYPNPFNPTTLIQFNLEKVEKVNLEIFNILGQKVRTLLSGEEFAAGPYSFIWDGKDNRGSPVSSGVYFYKLQTPTYLKTKKMMLVK